MAKEKPKGGPGSGRRGDGRLEGRGHITPAAKPNGGYTEQPSSRNPGAPRAGVRPSDLFPERNKPKN